MGSIADRGAGVNSVAPRPNPVDSACARRARGFPVGASSTGRMDAFRAFRGKRPAKWAGRVRRCARPHPAISGSRSFGVCDPVCPVVQFTSCRRFRRSTSYVIGTRSGHTRMPNWRASLKAATPTKGIALPLPTRRRLPHRSRASCNFRVLAAKPKRQSYWAKHNRCQTRDWNGPPCTRPAVSRLQAEGQPRRLVQQIQMANRPRRSTPPKGSDTMPWSGSSWSVERRRRRRRLRR